MVAHLAFTEQHDDWAALIIADRMQLGVQSTFGSPDTTGNIPFFSRLAAVRCALRCVASIMIRSGFGPSPARAAKMRSKGIVKLTKLGAWWAMRVHDRP
jgi:hypothetical protein